MALAFDLGGSASLSFAGSLVILLRCGREAAGLLSFERDWGKSTVSLSLGFLALFTVFRGGL